MSDYTTTEASTMLLRLYDLALETGRTEEADTALKAMTQFITHVNDHMVRAAEAMNKAAQEIILLRMELGEARRG